MTRPVRSLQQLQQWMQAVITHHSGVTAGVDSVEAQRILGLNSIHLDEVISPGPAQSSLERLAVYGNAYYARLMSCLREQFPACRYCVGDDIFDEFAFGYLQQHAPRTYTLGDLASEFVGFLEQTRNEHLTSGVDCSATDTSQLNDADDWTRFVVELARYEYMLDKVFDGPGIEHDSRFVAAQFDAVPTSSWPSIRLVPAVCLHVLAFEFPVDEYYSAMRRKESPQLPCREASFVAITRRSYVVRRYRLTHVQYELLSAITQGHSIGQSVAWARQFVPDRNEYEESLSSWFSFWAREEFFSRVATESPSLTHLEQ